MRHKLSHRACKYRIPLCSEMTATFDPSDLGAWLRMYKITWKTFLARRQQVLDLEATTHRMESLLDRAPAPAFESLYLAAKA